MSNTQYLGMHFSGSQLTPNLERTLFVGILHHYKDVCYIWWNLPWTQYFPNALVVNIKDAFPTFPFEHVIMLRTVPFPMRNGTFLYKENVHNPLGHISFHISWFFLWGRIIHMGAFNTRWLFLEAYSETPSWIYDYSVEMLVLLGYDAPRLVRSDLSTIHVTTHFHPKDDTLAPPLITFVVT